MPPTPGTVTPPDDAELTRLIQAERIRMLFAPTLPVAVVSALAAAGLALAVVQQTGLTWALAWAALCLLVPASLALLARQDAYGLFRGLGLLSLLALMLFEGRRAERRITELLWLRFTTDRIARERSAALVMAQRHSAVKDRFLATMSHEMRTPLHGILGLARLTPERLPDRPGVLAESRHQLQLIERACACSPTSACRSPAGCRATPPACARCCTTCWATRSSSPTGAKCGCGCRATPARATPCASTSRTPAWASRPRRCP
ncbi:MAG: hypothetical protein IIA02_06725 [Proteobacteria bacterium]|nr:hypothetical protein [Pseudomonadota bacterium]